MTILLIDDDEDDRTLFFEAIAEYDDTIKYVAATDAMEALLYLNDAANALPDLIFLDLRMPGLTGEECLIEIKRNLRLASIPVLIYTISRDEKEAVRLKGLGAAHFMSKPLMSDDVYYMVSFVLGEKWT
jgi:CheY-like chemotaxis protein